MIKFFNLTNELYRGTKAICPRPDQCKSGASGALIVPNYPNKTPYKFSISLLGTRMPLDLFGAATERRRAADRLRGRFRMGRRSGVGVWLRRRSENNGQSISGGAPKSSGAGLSQPAADDWDLVTHSTAHRRFASGPPGRPRPWHRFGRRFA